MSPVALVCPPGDEFAEGATVTFVGARPIDAGLARTQHAAYVDALGAGGYSVVELPSPPGSPDATFVEDLGFGLPEGWVLGRNRAPVRSNELGEARRWYDFDGSGVVVDVEAPGTLDGGDVLVVGRTVHVGLSGRTNLEAARQVEEAVSAWGYSVRPVPVRGALHLKTACTAIDDETVLLNPEWVDPSALKGYRVMEVAHGEPFGANLLPLGGRVLMSASAPRTADMVGRLGVEVIALDVSEFEKAEGGLTCLSLRRG